jgi:hypothetical protein
MIDKITAYRSTMVPAAIAAVIQSVLPGPRAPAAGHGGFLLGLDGLGGLLGGEMVVGCLGHSLAGDVHKLTKIKVFRAVDALAKFLLGTDGELKAIFDDFVLVTYSELVANKLPSKDEKACHRLARAVLESGTVGFCIMERKVEVFDCIEKVPEVPDLFRSRNEKRIGNNSAIATPSTVHSRRYLGLQCHQIIFSDAIVPPFLILKAQDGGGEAAELVERHDDTALVKIMRAFPWLSTLNANSTQVLK